MDNLPVQQSFFLPVIPFIQAMGSRSYNKVPGLYTFQEGYIEIGLPDDMVIDKDTILQYFTDDAEIGYQRTNVFGWPARMLRGTMKDITLWKWIQREWDALLEKKYKGGYYDAYGTEFSRTTLPVLTKWLENEKFESEDSFEQRKKFNKGR